MAHEQHTAPLPPDELQLGEWAGRLRNWGSLLAVVGLGASALLAMRMPPELAAHAYLVAVVFFMSIAFGALFFVQVQHLARAGWSVVVRRLAEIVATSLPALFLCMLPLWVGLGRHSGALFGWADPIVVAHDALLQNKAAYLNVPFFVVRSGIYLTGWWLASRFFFGRSCRQDASGDLKHSYTMQWVAAPAMAFYVLSITFFAFDYLMSLQPRFISTLFGVYFFAGCAMSFFACTTILSRFLQARGKLVHAITTEHYHDLGKFMFGFVFFWGYVAFSQYMLIWYGNIPEETEWFLPRQTGSWMWFSLLLPVGHFALPFATILSRHVKRHRLALAACAVWLLAMEWVDLYWLIMPSASEEAPPLSLLDLTAWLGMAGVFVAHFGHKAKKVALVPLKDPRLDESLTFENA